MKKNEEPTAYAQENIEITFTSLDGKPITLKTNKRTMAILDLKTKTFRIENYYWFYFKDFIKRLFNSRAK